MIREERPQDHGAIYQINLAAFGRPDEANLVDELRAGGAVLVSLVAEIDTQPVGHILFTRMWIDSIPAVALAPMAVLPAHQRRGIGAELIRRGLELLRERSERIVIVLGHPDYYPRFGFTAEKARALEHPFPREALMALELEPDALENARGKLRYDEAFGIRF